MARTVKQVMVYLVVELYKNGEPPRIISAWNTRKAAEKAAYDPRELYWRNVIPVTVQRG